jgi:hypothetical protein
MAKQTIWIEKTKFSNTLKDIEKELEHAEKVIRAIQKMILQFKVAIIYEEKSQ